MIPGEDLTVEEKVAEIQANPMRKLDFDRKLQRIENQKFAKESTATLRKQQADEALRTEVRGAVAELQKLPFWKEIVPVIDRWNKAVPMDKPLDGKQRVDVMYRLARLDRLVKTEIPQLVAKAQEHAKQAVHAQYAAAGAVPAGMAPSGQPPAGGEAPASGEIPAAVTSKFVEALEGAGV